MIKYINTKIDAAIIATGSLSRIDIYSDEFYLKEKSKYMYV